MISHVISILIRPSLFFFNDTATTEIYTLSLHDALPICQGRSRRPVAAGLHVRLAPGGHDQVRSEEHTSELQSRPHIVCRLLLEKKTVKDWGLKRQASRAMSAALSIPTKKCRPMAPPYGP